MQGAKTGLRLLLSCGSVSLAQDNLRESSLHTRIKDVRIKEAVKALPAGGLRVCKQFLEGLHLGVDLVRVV